MSQETWVLILALPLTYHVIWVGYLSPSYDWLSFLICSRGI